MSDNKVNLLGGMKMQLCDTGMELRQAWSEAVKTADPHAMKQSAQAYFVHKNGTMNSRGKVLIQPCGACGKYEEADEAK